LPHPLALAAPLPPVCHRRQADPQLLGLAPPLFAEAAGQAPREAAPRAAQRRRRVASLHFEDGSSCSCAADCGTDGGAAAAQQAEGLPPECCADVADGRRALCTPPEEAEAAAPLGLAYGDAEQPQPEMPLPRCPAPRAGVASRGGGAPLQLLLLNRAPFPVTLAFVDATGEEVALRTLRVREHAEYETLATHAWRVRTLGGHLLVEVAPGDLTAPPAAESGGVVTVYVNECQW